jgi:thymidylate kinase
MKTFTVALIGADGAGKTTVGLRLERDFARPIKYIYLGMNADASNVLLPTTRVLNAFRRARGAPSQGGPPDASKRRSRPKGLRRRVLRELKSIVGLTNRLAEEWYRQTLAWYYLRRGMIVVFDRHFYSDYYAHDIAVDAADRSLSRRVHGFMLKHMYPKPNFVILLDAPAEVLWARKQEGTPEALVRRREEYLRLRELVDDMAIVDATQPQDAVVDEVGRLILGHTANGGSGRSR